MSKGSVISLAHLDSLADKRSSVEFLMLWESFALSVSCKFGQDHDLTWNQHLNSGSLEIEGVYQLMMIVIKELSNSLLPVHMN